MKQAMTQSRVFYHNAEQYAWLLSLSVLGHSHLYEKDDDDVNKTQLSLI